MNRDVVVVGAGIVGLAVARELALRHDGLSVAVVEREPTIAGHQTSHSSGVIHSGIYYEPGSLKARLCVAGARELYEYCDERGIPAQRSGKLILATAGSELGRLDELERRGRANGVAGLARLDPAGMAAVEPHAVGVAALHAPNTGIVDFARVAASYADDLRSRGGTVVTSCAVAGVDGTDSGVTVRHAAGTTRARAAIVCAGAWADRLARAAGAPAEPRIVPFRGAYLRLVRSPRRTRARKHLPRARSRAAVPRRSPDPRLRRRGPARADGADRGRPRRLPGAPVRAADLRETLAWPGTWKLARRFWRAGATEILHAVSRRALVAAAQRLVPELRPGDFVAGPSGIRAQAVARDGSLVDDFLVSSTGRALFVRNAPSPAATSSLPFGRMIADEAEPLLA